MTTLSFAISLFVFISICIDYTLSATPLIQDLPDSSFTASSSYPNAVCYPQQVKFTTDDSYSWCCGQSNTNCIDDQDYLTIDLEEIKAIESVSTKGRFSSGVCIQKVKSYNLQYSIDGNSYISYNLNPLFNNNNDSDCNEIINVLDNYIQAQYLRIYPLTYGGEAGAGYPSMKFEAYECDGCDVSTTKEYNSALIQDLPDSSFTATSSYANVVCYPQESKFTTDASYAWCCGTSAANCDLGTDYLQVDLTEIKKIEAVSTKGRLSSGVCIQNVKSYNLKYSIDGNSYTSYNSNPLYSNNDETDCNEVINVLDNYIQARYLRFYPLSYDNYPSMNVEAYEYIGCGDESTTEFHISFLLDESGSIEEDNPEGSWDTMIDFVKDVIGRDINDNSYVNVITFSNRNDINTIYSFSDQSSQSSDRTEIYDALDDIVYDGGGTFTYNGIRAAIDEFETAGFTENNVLFVITDGEYSSESNDPCDLSSPLSSNNIALIEIAVNTDYSMDCADYKFVVDSFSQDDFDEVAGEINDITCIECELYEPVCCSNGYSSSSSSSAITYNNYNYDNYSEFYHSQWIGFIAGFISCFALIGLISFCNYLLMINKGLPNSKKVYQSVQIVDSEDEQSMMKMNQ